MKTIQLFLCFLLLSSNVLQTVLTGKVVGVSDGDTIKVLVDGQPVKVRLNRIDAPEKSQAYGTKAKEFTSSLCFNKTVTLITKGKDKYGRTIAEVILPDKVSLNQELVRNGFAWHYLKYSNDSTLARLETEARKNRVGLWADKEPMAPWEFRKLKKKK